MRSRHLRPSISSLSDLPALRLLPFSLFSLVFSGNLQHRSSLSNLPRRLPGYTLNRPPSPGSSRLTGGTLLLWPEPPSSSPESGPCPRSGPVPTPPGPPPPAAAASWAPGQPRAPPTGARTASAGRLFPDFSPVSGLCSKPPGGPEALSLLPGRYFSQGNPRLPRPCLGFLFWSLLLW